MYITKEKFEEIKKKYPTLLVVENDADDALSFARDLLEAEADAVREKAPYATRSIERLEQAAREVNDLCSELGDFLE